MRETFLLARQHIIYSFFLFHPHRWATVLNVRANGAKAAFSVCYEAYLLYHQRKLTNLVKSKWANKRERAMWLTSTLKSGLFFVAALSQHVRFAMRHAFGVASNRNVDKVFNFVFSFLFFISISGPSCEAERWRRTGCRSITRLRTNAGIRECHTHRDAVQAKTRHMWYVLRRPNFGKFPIHFNSPHLLILKVVCDLTTASTSSETGRLSSQKGHAFENDYIWLSQTQSAEKRNLQVTTDGQYSVCARNIPDDFRSFCVPVDTFYAAWQVLSHVTERVFFGSYETIVFHILELKLDAGSRPTNIGSFVWMSNASTAYTPLPTAIFEGASNRKSARRIAHLWCCVSVCVCVCVNASDESKENDLCNLQIAFTTFIYLRVPRGTEIKRRTNTYPLIAFYHSLNIGCYQGCDGWRNQLPRLYPFAAHSIQPIQPCKFVIEF